MASYNRQPAGGSGRPRSKTPAERGEEFAAHQKRLKEEAGERRKTAVPRPDSSASRSRGRRG
jgi:hypothetical protein